MFTTSWNSLYWGSLYQGLSVLPRKILFVLWHKRVCTEIEKYKKLFAKWSWDLGPKHFRSLNVDLRQIRNWMKFFFQIILFSSNYILLYICGHWFTFICYKSLVVHYYDYFFQILFIYLSREWEKKSTLWKLFKENWFFKVYV